MTLGKYNMMMMMMMFNVHTAQNTIQ